MEFSKITDSMLADYQQAWDYADSVPKKLRDPGDRRRAGLAAVAPALVEAALREAWDELVDTGEAYRVERVMRKWGIEP